MGRISRSWLVAAGLAAALLVPAPAGAARPARGLELGFADAAFTGPGAAQAMARGAGIGGRLVRLDGAWSAIARTRPADERDPADPAYDFAVLDTAVRAAAARGLEPLVLTTGAPAWAEGPGRPAAVEDGPDVRVGPGAWKPDPDAFGRFGTALARRYSGTFKPAGAAHALPRVRRFQAWNEPNLNTYLAPQWERAASGYRAFSPGRYRALLNAFTVAVKAVHADDLVVTAGTAPFGNPPGEWRRRPLAFWRDVLCASAACPDPARFDVLAHHPYSLPQDDSYSADDLPVKGVPRLVTLLRRAERLHRVLGPARHRLWITELGIETNPPDPDGVTTAVQAYDLQLSLYLLWRAGADTIAWFEVGDAPPGPGYPATVQSGLFLQSGKAKPAARAYAFPFVTDPDRPRLYWGLAPRRGVVVIERRTHRGWTRAARVVVGAGRVFTGRGTWASGTRLRAREGSRTSVVWNAL